MAEATRGLLPLNILISFRLVTCNTLHESPSYSYYDNLATIQTVSTGQLNTLQDSFHGTTSYARMLRVTRPVLSLRSPYLTPIRAGPSSLPARPPQADRYLAVRAFFTRQASLLVQPLPCARRSRSSFAPNRQNSSSSHPDRPSPNETASKPTSEAKAAQASGLTQDYTPFIRRLILQSGSLLKNSHNRPTKDELLAASGSWFERLRIRLRWFTIRGWRRFNTDDFSAFASWFVVGNSE